MIILTNFLVAFAFFACFTLAYFSVDRLLSTKRFINIGIPTEGINLIFGLIIGIVSMLTTYLTYSSGNNNHVFFLVISVVLLAFFKNWQSSLFSMIPTLIYLLITNDINRILVYQLIVSFILIFIIVAGNFLIPENKRWISVSSTLAILAVFSLPFVYLYFKDMTIIDRIESTTLTYVWTVIFFGVFYFFIKFTISSNILFQSSNFSFLNYYRPGLADKSILNKIIEKKINKGLVVIFEVTPKNNFLKKEQQRELKEAVLEIISKKAGKDTQLFFATEGRFGLFSPLQSTDDDFKEFLEYKLMNMPKKYRTSWGRVEEVAIKAGVSIYGVHDSSLDTLIKYSTFALNTISTDKDIKIFKTSEYLKSVRDYNSLIEMDKNISLDDYKNEFLELWTINNKISPFGARVKTANISEFSWIETIDEQIYYKNWNKLFTRYFAYEALKHIKNTNIIMDYDLSILEDNFDSTDFINQIIKQMVKPERVFLVVKKISIDRIKNHKIVKRNIEILMKNKINFVIESKVEKSVAIGLFEEIKYVILNDKQINNFPEAILIYDQVKMESEILQLKNLNVSIIGGPLIKNKLSFKKFDKQSKIYIEEILALEAQHDK